MSQRQGAIIGLGVAGAVAGYYLGPAGAEIFAQSYAGLGFAVGSTVGSLLFPPETPDQEVFGQRYDTKFTTSTYGVPRPVGFGVTKFAGNIIWATPIQEEKIVEETEQGGKGFGGGSTTTSTTYKYTTSFAVAFGEGPAEDVLRIWFDNKVVENKRGGSEDVEPELKPSYRFYPGTTTQDPDSLIVEDKGENRTPAFRNTVYIVFDNVDVTSYGARIPNVTAEIAYKATDTRPETQVSFLPTQVLDSTSGVFMAVNHDLSRLILVDATDPSNGLRRINLDSMEEEVQALWEDVLDQDYSESVDILASVPACVMLSNGDLIVHPRDGLTDFTHVLARINTDSLLETARSVTRYSTAHFMGKCELYDPFGLQEFVITFGTFAQEIGVSKVTSSGFSHVWQSDDGLISEPDWSGYSWEPTGGVQGKISNGYGEYFFMMEENGSPKTSLRLYKITIKVGGVISTTEEFYYNVEFDLVADLAVEDITLDDDEAEADEDLTGASEYTDGGNMICFDEADGNIIFNVQTSPTTNNSNFVVKVDADTGEILWVTKTYGNGPNIYPIQFHRVNGTIGYINEIDEWYYINTASGDIIQESPEALDWTTNPFSTHFGVWDSNNNTWTAITADGDVLTQYAFNKVNGAPATLDEIVSDVCQRSNLTTDLFDVSGITSYEVPGHLITGNVDGRSAIQSLQSLFFVSSVESDFVLYFRPRGASAVDINIDSDELIVVDETTGDVINQQRIQEVELPERLTFKFQDPDNNYEQGVQYAKRIVDPTPVMYSNNRVEASFPTSVFYNDDMKEYVHKHLHNAWSERTNNKFKLPWTYLDLDPDDFVTIDFPDTSIRTRLAEVSLGANFEMELAGLKNELNMLVFADFPGGYGGDTPPEDTTVGNPTVRTFILDTPLLLDQHEPPARQFAINYFTVAPNSVNDIRRAIVYQSRDNLTFSEIGTVIDGASWGISDVALPDPDPLTAWQKDKDTNFDITVVHGYDDFVSTSYSTMLNGANGLLVIKNNGEVEIIQFETVTQISDTKLRLTNLLRHRRGTDTMATGHTRGEICILLQTRFGGNFPLSLSSDLNTTLYYKGVPVGREFVTIRSQGHSSEHRCLKPYAPVKQEAFADSGSSITFTWLRRSRVGGDEFPEGTGEIPVNEDEEKYTLRIYDTDSSGFVEVREVTDITSPTYNYSSADQITDFGSTFDVGDTIHMEVVQISGQIGEGFSQIVSLKVK